MTHHWQALSVATHQANRCVLQILHKVMAGEIRKLNRPGWANLVICVCQSSRMAHDERRWRIHRHLRQPTLHVLTVNIQSTVKSIDTQQRRHTGPAVLLCPPSQGLRTHRRDDLRFQSRLGDLGDTRSQGRGVWLP